MSKEQEIALQKLDRLGLLSRKNYLHFQIVRYVIDGACGIARDIEIQSTQNEIDRIEDFLKQKEGVS